MKPALKSIPTLESLTLAWVLAKDEETQAVERRRAIEEQLAAALPCPSGIEGTRTEQVADYRVAVKYGLTRKVDSERLQALWQDLVPQAQAAFRWTAALTLPKWRALQELRPDIYASLVPIVETKPARPSVTVELAKDAA